MLETELMSLDREPKGIQWPPQEELAADADVPALASEKKVRQKYVRIFFGIFMILCASCILIHYI